MKKEYFFLVFSFILLTTFYFDFNKTRLAETFKIKNRDSRCRKCRYKFIKSKIRKIKYNNFLINRRQIATSIIDIDFINKVLIKKIYPDKVQIKIKEHKL